MRSAAARATSAALCAAVAVALVACAPSAAPTTASASVSADIVQERADVAAGVVGIVVTNDGHEPIVVDHAEWDSPALTTPLVAGDGSALVAGQRVALRAPLPPPTCDGDSGVGTVTVVLDDGAEVVVEPGDPYDQIARLTDDACALQALEAAADVGWGAVDVATPTLGTDATLHLRLTARGDEALTIRSVSSTTLFALVADGSAVTSLQLDQPVDATSGTVEIPITIRPGRCDAHAIAEDKQGTIFVVTVEQAGESSEVRLVSPEAQHDVLIAYAAAACGLG